MRTPTIKVVTFSGIFALLLTMFIWSCSKDDLVTPVAHNESTGKDMIVTEAASGWTLDKSHSNVNWQTLYYGDNALLNGKFNSFGIYLNFNQEKPENSSIKAWVVLSTFNTGEAGRDAYGKCGPGYMGVAFDTVTASPLKLAPRASTDTAWFNSKSVKKYGSGYMVEGDLNFRGVTKKTTMLMTYGGTYSYTGSTGAVTLRSGFEGKFTFLAQTDYGISSSSIADEVTVTVNANFRKNL